MCMSRESFNWLHISCIECWGLTRYLQLGATLQLPPFLLQVPDRWSQFWVLKITLLFDQLFDHKEVFKLAARQVTNRANDRLKHLSKWFCQDITLIVERQVGWPELCIEDGVYQWVDCGRDVAQPKWHDAHPWCFPGWWVKLKRITYCTNPFLSFHFWPCQCFFLSFYL